MQKAAITKEDGDVKLGQITESEFTTPGGEAISVSICLNSLNINTAAGSAPAIDASGESVEDKAESKCAFPVPGFTLPKQHHAFILWNAFTLTGSGCCLKTANYSLGCGISKAEKDGICLTHDVVEGRIDCAVEVLQTGPAEPTLVPGDGWIVTSQLTQTNPDADYPTWSATLTMYLSKE